MAPVDLDLGVEPVDVEGLPAPEPTSNEAGNWALADEVERIERSRATPAVEATGGAPTG